MNNKRIDDKIKGIEEYIQELEEIVPLNYKEYKQNFEKRAACERYFEKILEAVIDLAFLVAKENDFKVPEEDKQVFDILVEENIISEELAIKLKEAKGMRNVLAHQYGEVNDELVFESISEELTKDTLGFIKSIKNKI